MALTEHGQGERANGRDAVQKLVKAWTADGMKPADARKKALDIAHKYDKTNPK